MYFSSDPKIIRILWIILSIGIAFLLWTIYQNKSIEPFESSIDISENVIKIYYDTLHRAPNSDELKKHTNAILNKEYDYNEVELRIINSDEYQRLIKTQTNTILPETSRMLEEKALIQKIKNVYKKVRGKVAPKGILLPLKDLYIYFKYNVYKFVALLRDSKYPDFEGKVLADPNITKESLIDLYLATFDDAKLNYDADAIEQMDKALGKDAKFSNYLLSEEEGEGDQNKVNSAALLAFLLQNTKKAAEEKAGVTPGPSEADLARARQMLVTSTGEGGCTANQRIYLPNEAKVLKTDYGFQVMQKFPPVCIPVGKKNEPKDITVYSKLQGTSLQEADDTQVGSIMPKFEYREYIEIPVPGTKTPPPAPAPAKKK
jgi:hypothetical protein